MILLDRSAIDLESEESRHVDRTLETSIGVLCSRAHERPREERRLRRCDVSLISRQNVQYRKKIFDSLPNALYTATRSQNFSANLCDGSREKKQIPRSIFWENIFKRFPAGRWHAVDERKPKKKNIAAIGKARKKLGSSRTIY